jgi:hypothetical protein
MRLSFVPACSRSGWMSVLFPALVLACFVGCGGANDTGGAKPGTGGAGAGGSGGKATGGAAGIEGGAGGTGGMAAAGTGGSVPDGGAQDVVTPVDQNSTPDTSDAGGCPLGTACPLAGGKNGVCGAEGCAACKDPGDDAACVAAYGAGKICLQGSCATGGCRDSTGCPAGQQCNTSTHQCSDCTTDAACKGDTAYGAGYICVAGKCEKGDCHDTSLECPAGQICGVAKPHFCGPCAMAAQCVADTGRYGAGYVCSEGGKCAKGDCGGSSTECTGGKDGQICGVTTPNTCGACTEDSQCRADPRYKDAKPMCFTAAGADNGRCVANTCPTNGQKCAGNAADICCGNKCIPGSCCDGDDAPCKAMGAAFTCVANTCTTCDTVAGNQYFVDPVGGNDTAATGSGKGGGIASRACMFKTLSAALERLPATPAAGTTITIVGEAGKVTQLVAAAEKYPIKIPENVKVTTQDGAIELKLPEGKEGFHLLGKNAALTPAGTARLTIDGAGKAKAGVTVKLASNSDEITITNVVITKTNDDGMRILAGTAHIGAGIEVSDAGTSAAKFSGLDVAGGRANIDVATGKAVFANNSKHGISVTLLGELDITGKPAGAPGGGDGTIVVRNNGDAGIHIGQKPADPALKNNDVRGVVAHANQGPGLRVQGGSRLKLRDSVLLANGGSGVSIEPADATDAGNGVANIDLGVMNDPGKNILQNLLGSNPNTGAGLCVDVPKPAVGAVVKARGNTFAGAGAALDCAATTPPSKITISDTCGRVNVGVRKLAGVLTIPVDLLNCTQN